MQKSTRQLLSESYHHAVEQLHYHSKKGDESASRKWADTAEAVARQCIEVTGEPIDLVAAIA